MQKESMPIGVFDSGVGGVSVLKEMLTLMPNENYIYLADSKNAPYGTKSHEEILIHATNCADYLVSQGVKALVVACNTATSVCIAPLREKYPDMPIVGIEPAIKPALECKENTMIAVMATPLTLKEEKFAKLVEVYDASSRIIPLPCPGLMEIVEKGLLGKGEAYEYLDKLFKSISDVDAVVLGCTHYPFLKGIISAILPHARIYDGGQGTARQLNRLLEAEGLLNPSQGSSSVVFKNTLDDESKNDLALYLLEE